MRRQGLDRRRGCELGFGPADLTDDDSGPARLGEVLHHDGALGGLAVDDHGVGPRVHGPLHLGAVGGLLAGRVDAIQHFDANHVQRLLESIGGELVPGGGGGHDDDRLRAQSLGVERVGDALALVAALCPEDRLAGASTHVHGDHAAVHRRHERPVVGLLPVQHEVAVGEVLVRGTQHDVDPVLLKQLADRLSLADGADVLVDDLDGAPERRVQVDDLVDREVRLGCQEGPDRSEVAGPDGQVAQQDRLNLFGGRLRRRWRFGCGIRRWCGSGSGVRRRGAVVLVAAGGRHKADRQQNCPPSPHPAARTLGARGPSVCGSHVLFPFLNWSVGMTISRVWVGPVDGPTHSVCYEVTSPRT